MPSKPTNDEERPSDNWLKKEFLDTALRKWLGYPRINVTEFLSKRATKNGDCYSSHMYRVTVRCEQRKKPLTVITKRLIDVDYSGEAFATPLVREVTMLRDVLPDMYRVLKKVLPEMEPLGPNYIHSTPEGVLVMEDLQEGGFQMADRHVGLDLKHCHLVLRTLARYHAASVFLMENKSMDFSVFQKSLFGASNVVFGNFCNGMLRGLSQEVENFEGMERYAAKISAFTRENFRVRLEKAVDLHEDDDFLVLSHGDLWVNNILFRYSSSGDLDGVRFVDFQLPSITSPCVDIQFFLTSSCGEAVRSVGTDQLLEAYHQTLCQTMTALKCSTNPPTLEKLKKDYDRKTDCGMYALACVMPLMFSEPTQCELSQVADGGRPKGELFSSESYKKALEWFLPLYECKGYL